MGPREGQDEHPGVAPLTNHRASSSALTPAVALLLRYCRVEKQQPASRARLGDRGEATVAYAKLGSKPFAADGRTAGPPVAAAAAVVLRCDVRIRLRTGRELGSRSRIARLDRAWRQGSGASR